MSAREIPIAELGEYTTSLARDVMKDHEKRFADRIKSVREAASNLNSAATRFESAVRVAWGTLDKTTSEYGVRLAHLLEENSQLISKYETYSNYLDAEQFSEQSVQTLNKIILNVRKYVPKLHRSLRTELATLNSSLAKLENSVKALDLALDQSPGARLEPLHREVHQIIQRQTDLLKKKAAEQNESSALQALSEEERKIENDREALMSGPEFQELAHYENAIELKAEEIRQFFQPLTKPLLKLERMASMKQISINVGLLHNLLDNPAQTIIATQSFTLSDLLNRLEEQLNQHQLDVEEKRRRKADETIDAIRQGAIDKFREDYLALQANSQETIRQLKSKGLLHQRDALVELCSAKRLQIQDRSAKKRDLDREIDELSRAILKQKTAIESQISAIAHRTITILTE